MANPSSFDQIGDSMYAWACHLFPICRSLMGDGNRETLRYLKQIVEDIELKSVKTGFSAFDWNVPQEWRINEAWIKDSQGNLIVDFCDNNLHVVGYSIPVDKTLTLEELQPFLHSLPNQPNAIPYITSYYSKTWGFCLTDNHRRSLKPGSYHVYIDSSHYDGTLDYGELIVKGKSSKEIFLSTYICHPSMANNELSGPVVATAIAKWLLAQKNLRYSYRIIFIPETIGSLVYLSLNLDLLKKNVVAGFNLTCLGDDNTFSFLPSRNGHTLSDRAARYALNLIYPDFDEYTWNERGGDERQYCAPGIDLPVSSIMRSKYHVYPEYHTSLDNLDFISPKGLAGGYNVIINAITTIEQNLIPSCRVLGEPFLSKYDLYPTLSRYSGKRSYKVLVDLLTYSDGQSDLLQISQLSGHSVQDLHDATLQLVDRDLLRITS